MEDKSLYRYCFISRIVIEAVTPLAVGSGDKDIITDARVAKDVNGLPYIPGTSLAGIIRHAVGENNSESHIWGFQKRNGGRGSQIIFTNANIMDEDGTVTDGFAKKSGFLNHFIDLPIRQHAKLNEKGTAANTGKFDEEIVYKGTRFCFEIELMMTDGSLEADKADFNHILSELYSKTFRIGGGTRSGFGEVKVISCKRRTLDLKDNNDMQAYLQKSSSLADSSFWASAETFKAPGKQENDWTTYRLELKPDGFFLFGSGYGDEEVDMTPVKEAYIDWSGDHAVFKDGNILIPASSVKGAIAHRVAYYYNQKTNYWADLQETDDYEKHVGKNNKAVKALFGTEDTDDPHVQRGHVMISDVIQKESGKSTDKILNHVSIDRFTGGAIDGALFSEKVSDCSNDNFALTIMVEKNAIEDKKVKESLESALDDICNGLLPLGGGVNRGNGVFTGKYKQED